MKGITEQTLTDAELIAHTLEMVAVRSHDISSLVYANFFASCPESTNLFKVIDPTQPPHGCGQMLFEILSLIQDSAEQKSYVAGYMQQIAINHKSFGVQAIDFYRKFMTSLVAVLAETLDSNWSVEIANAWSRQSEVLISFIHPQPRSS